MKAAKIGTFLLVVRHLCTMLPLLTKLSTRFQQANLNMADVSLLISIAWQGLRSSKKRHGAHKNVFLPRKDGVSPTDNQDQHAEVQDYRQVLDSLHASRKQFLHTLMDGLGQHFTVKAFVEFSGSLSSSNLPSVGDKALDS